MKELYLKPETFIDHILAGIREKTDLAVIGLSGGADSTLVAILCALALGKDKVFGISMPYGATDEKTFNSRSQSLANKLGINHMTLPISTPVVSVATTVAQGLKIMNEEDGFLKHASISTLNEGNLRSRMRMVYLYTTCCGISEAHPGLRVRVIGTGNLSEDFIGYDTKGGDALADLFPIGQLYKSEVYASLDFFREKGVIDEEHIDRVPSAGLWEGQTDEEELGYSYNEMAPAVSLCLRLVKAGLDPMDPQFVYEEDPKMGELVKFVWHRHLANRHKHMGSEVIDLGR